MEDVPWPSSAVVKPCDPILCEKCFLNYRDLCFCIQGKVTYCWQFAWPHGVNFNPFSASPIFSQVQKFFLENLLLARFLCCRDTSRDQLYFFREDWTFFFFSIHINKKIKPEMRYLDK